MRKMLRWAAVGATVATAGAVLSVTTMAGATTTPAKAATALSVKVAKGQVVPGGTDVISGKLTSAGKPVPGKVVWLDKVVTVNGKTKLVFLFAKPTSVAGKATYTVKPAATATYELIFLGDRRAPRSRSPSPSSAPPASF